MNHRKKNYLPAFIYAIICFIFRINKKYPIYIHSDIQNIVRSIINRFAFVEGVYKTFFSHYLSNPDANSMRNLYFKIDLDCFFKEPWKFYEFVENINNHFGWEIPYKSRIFSIKIACWKHKEKFFFENIIEEFDIFGW